MSQDPQQAKPSPEEPEKSAPPKRKRRLWLRILLAVVVLLIALVALGPTIASTGMVRSIVVGKINDNLNGHVEIGGWSLGWFSPISLSNIKVYDEQKELVLDVERVKLGISLLDAIRSNFALGTDNVIDVNSFLVKVDETGQTNLQKLPKAPHAPRPAAVPVKAEPFKLPDVSGTVTVNFKGKIEQGTGLPVFVDPSTAIVTISEINKPIENHVKFAYRIGETGASSSIETTGSFGAIKENILDITKLAAGQKIDLSNVNLAAIEPFLKALGADTHLAGMVKGGIEIKTQDLTGLSANGQITITGLAFGGGPLGQDSFQSQQISIPVNVTRTADSSGGATIKFENVGVKMDQASVNVTGEVSEQALLNLSQNKAPGGTGSISISADVPDISKIANQLPHTLHLVEGVQLTGGAVHQQLTIALDAKQVTLSQNLSADATGTRNGQPIKLQPISFNASAVAVPNGKSIPDLKNLKIDLQTVFAKITGGGESLSKTNIDGNFDLGKLMSEVSQFADMGAVQLQGAGRFNVKTDGDLADSTKPITVQAQADIQNLKLDGLGDAKLNVDSNSFTTTAEASFVDGKVTLTKPATLAIAGLSVSKMGQAIISNDAVRGSINGDVSFKDGIAANFTDLSVDTDSKMFAVAKAGNGPLSFSMTHTNNQPAMKGSGVLSVAADLSKLSRLAQSFSGTPASADQPQLRSGQLTGSLTLARTDQTAIDFSGQISGLTIIVNNANVLDNEQMTLALNAKAPDDLTKNPIVATGKIGSSFFTTDLSDVKLAMAGAKLDMLQSARLDVQAPDAVKLFAMAQAFMPAPPAGTSPLEVTSGSATAKVAVTRDAANKTTTVNVTDTQISKLALKRGKQTYAFDATPITVKLTAAVQGADDIQSIKVQELSGDMRIAKLSMPDPIVITNVMSDKPSYQGSIGLTGKIDDATPLLAVIQGGEQMPYAGQYNVAQKLSTADGKVTLNGSVDVSNFQVLDQKKVVFTEPKVAIRNDADVDIAQRKLAVRTLTLDMPSSKAIALSFTGGVNDWMTKRDIRAGTKLDVTYDLEKVWTIARPMLSPEQQASYKDLKIAGKYTKTFNLSGAFPSTPTLAQSIKSLNADGGLTIDLLDTSGLTIQKLSPQVKMVRGVVTLSGSNAVANDGTIDFAGIVADLTQPQPTITIPKNKKLLQNVKLNPVLAGALGKMGAVLLTDASTAQGLLNLTINSCDRLPLGELTQQNKNFDASATLSVENLFLDGPVPQAISTFTDLGKDGIHGSIPPSTIAITKGVAQTKLTVQMDRTVNDRRAGTINKPIQMVFAGAMVLSTMELQKFTITVPPELLLPDMRKFLPNGGVIALKGKANALKPDLDTAIKENIGKSILGGQGGDNPVGDLLKGLGGGNNDRQQNQPRQRNQGQ